MKPLILITAFAFFASSSGFCATPPPPPQQQQQQQQNTERPYNIPLPGGGSYQATAQEYKQWQAQQQRQQFQQQIQQQLQNIKNGSNKGNGNGNGSSSLSNNSNALKPIDASAFGQIPNFSSGPAQQAIQQLVAQSSQPDPDSQKFLEDMKQQIKESTKKAQLPQLSDSLKDFNQLLAETLSAIQNLPSTLSSNDKLLKQSVVGKRRRAVGRPLDVPRYGGTVVGISYPSIARRGLASLVMGSMAKSQLPLQEKSPATVVRSVKGSRHGK